MCSQYLEQTKQVNDVSALRLCEGIRRKSFFLGEKPFSSPPTPCPICQSSVWSLKLH